MYGTYKPDQKFDLIRISVLRDISMKTITHIEDVKNIFCCKGNNNNAEKLLTDR